MAGKAVTTAIILLILISILIKPAAAAQTPEFRLDMDSIQMQKGVSSSFVISIINADGAQIIDIEGLEGFDILSQSQSSSQSIVGNVSSLQVNMYFTVMPKVAGEYAIKAIIKYNGKEYETNTMEVSVTEEAVNANSANPDLFVETVISHQESYIGEKIVLTYEVYARESVDSIAFSEYIAIDGAIAVEIGDGEIATEVVYIDGKMYTKYTVKQLIIDPLKARTCIIPSYNLQVNVISNDRLGGFGWMPFQTTTPKYLQTQEKKVLVKALPSDGKPSDFSGIVGELVLEGQYSREEVTYKDSLALQIKAFGECNLDALKSLMESGIDGFSVYETQKRSAEYIEDGVYRAEKDFEVILVAEETGEIDIEPVRISYFSPKESRYLTAQIPGTTVTILGDKESTKTAETLETIVINQISYHPSSSGALWEGYIRIPQWSLFLLPGAAIVLILLRFAVKKSKKTGNRTLLVLYKQMMNAKNENDIYSIFSAMIKHCYNVSLKASSLEYIRQAIPDSELAEEIAEIMNKLDHCENNDIQLLKSKIRKIYLLKLKNCT